ncbi:MAG: DUF882 domain-containing protein [Beijerinckiaceae bacterium]|nr:DUF882 domain-containing protein [Beijerinckiaceae bacterium]
MVLASGASQARCALARWRHRAGVAALSLAALVVGSRTTQDAVANGDTRTISIQHMHTKELTTVTFRRDGRYVGEALDKLNNALRDWRNDDVIKMDPRLFDIAWEVHREVGSSSPFHVVSAYRSPGTNAMLRRRSRGVAKHSQHTMGKAMDFYLPDISTAQIRAVGMKLQRGGVGYYPTANTPFVHLDVGSVRSWPRMTRDQLARIFPNGNTVHIAADGKPMEGYEVAKAQILARGGSVGGYASSDFDEGAIMQSSRRSLWASLFGWNEEEEAVTTRGRGRARSASSQQTLAYAPSGGGENSDLYSIMRPPAADTLAPASARTPARGRTAETQVAALPRSTEAEAPAAPAPVPAQAPASPVPAQPRFVAAPFPIARPSNLAPVQLASVEPGSTGQRLNWQQGPSGIPAGAEQAQPAPAGRLVVAPVPPRRPDDPPQSASPGLALAAAATVPVNAQAPAPAATRDPPGRLVAINHPLPPERPRLAVAAAQPSAGAGLAASPALAAPAAGRSTAPARPAANPDRSALDNLFAAVATGSLPDSAAKVTTTRARTTQPQAGPVASDAAPAASLGFTQRDPNDTRPDRFSGPAVRPLPTNYTSR